MSTLQVEKTRLPAGAIAQELNSALQDNPIVVLSAPAGAGKSTLLPLTVLESLPENGKIIMLEPRRMAARQIAERMSEILEEPLGKTVGYRIRFETKVSSSTRIEVVTEGILTRMLVSDPTLEGVSVIIFDEFHERSLTSDVDLALSRRAQSIVRDDLRILIMSATIDCSSICKSLSAPLVSCQGRMFPVEEFYSSADTDAASCAEDIARTIRKAYRENDGDILAFLPGEADIRKCGSLVEGAFDQSTRVYPLYGQLPPKEQKAAISPSADGTRKIVLSTPIAETSLTIGGIKTVVDSGLYRKMVFNPQNGLSHLQTVRISLDMAQQRKGRAGRVSSGVCYHLYSKGTESRLSPFRSPEILEADLSPMVLDIAAWGESDPESLDWLTPPPPSHIQSAKTLLKMLGAIDGSGAITKHGTSMSRLSCHPRISNMLCRAQSDSLKALAADIAALLEEKDPLSSENDCNFTTRVSVLRQKRRSGSSKGGWDRIIRIADQYRAMAKAGQDDSEPDAYSIGKLLAMAYPERIALQDKSSHGVYRLSCGEYVSIDPSDQMSSYEWLSVASVTSSRNALGRIFLASPLDPQDLSDILEHRDTIIWDSKQGAVRAMHEKRLGCLLVGSSPLVGDISDKILSAIAEAAPKDGLGMFDFSDRVQNLQRRISCAREWHPELELPQVDTQAVLCRASEWLPFHIGSARTRDELRKIDMCSVIWGMLSYDQQTQVDRIAPTHIEVPTGSRIRIEYRQGADAPVLRVRLQECFGMKDTPRVDMGRRPVLMELLSPGFKPVQLTMDLASFWSGTYFEVRKELKRRYPKHSWPDDPLEAEAVRGVRKR